MKTGSSQLIATPPEKNRATVTGKACAKLWWRSD